MEDIKVGEYVRTNRGIGQVLEVKTVQPKMYGKHDMAYKIDICPRMYVTDTNIIKHSKNIIDLIEVGDFVNGYLVIDTDKNREMLCILMPFNEENQSKYNIVWKTKYYIKTILTKEQYMQNCYKLEKVEEEK